MNSLVALGHFLSQQERMFSPSTKTIQFLYETSKEKFENECKAKEKKLETIQDLCQKAIRQFQKIVSCLDEGTLEKAEQYAKDGVEFFFLRSLLQGRKKKRDILSITYSNEKTLKFSYHNKSKKTWIFSWTIVLFSNENTYIPMVLEGNVNYSQFRK